MRRGVVGIGCVLAAQLGCFAVEPAPACADQSGLYERGHVCMPPGLDLALPGAPWLLRRAMFNGDGVDDLAVGLARGSQRSVHVTTELAGAGKLRQVAEAAGLTDFVASHVYGDATGVHDLVTLRDTKDLENGGELAIHACGADAFASGERVSFVLKGEALGLPCSRPASLAAIGDGMAADVGWGIACESMPRPEDKLVEPADIGFFISPVYEPGGVFDAYGDFHFSRTHAVVSARINDGAFLGFGFAAVPESGDSDIIAITYDNQDPGRPSGSSVMPERGLISRLYATDLDGDGVDEFVALHRKGDMITISRRTQKDPPTYAPLDRTEYDGVFAVPGPLAAAFGDFTGDGELDIAVALANPDGSTGVGVYIRWPDQGEGFYYVSLGALRGFEGETVVDLVALDADGDGRSDLAVALATASDGGRLRVFLNRSVAPG